MRSDVVLGIFVGGRSRRMGRPKGLLVAPATGETLVERAARLGRESGLEPVLVGAADPYEGLLPGVPRLPDEPAGIGPLGGLRALLRQHPRAIALACDMPRVGRELLELLRDAPSAPAVAPRGRYWEPLCARYEASALPAIDAAIAEGRHGLQSLMGRLDARVLEVPPELLVDWDTPEDLPERGA